MNFARHVIPFFIIYTRTSVGNSLQYLIWLKSKPVKIYSYLKCVKLLLALSIDQINGSTKYSAFVFDVSFNIKPNAARFRQFKVKFFM